MTDRAERRGNLAGAALVKLLLDFDPAEQSPADIVRSMKALANAAGFSVKTVQRTLEAYDIQLPVWGTPGGSAPVFLPKAKLPVLRQLIFRRIG